MTRVLVTGAGGQVGQCLQKIAQNYSKILFEFKDSDELDITDTQMVSTTFSSGNFDFCINCAAFTDVEQAEKTPEKAFSVNAEGV